MQAGKIILLAILVLTHILLDVIIPMPIGLTGIDFVTKSTILIFDWLSISGANLIFWVIQIYHQIQTIP